MMNLLNNINSCLLSASFSHQCQQTWLYALIAFVCICGLMIFLLLKAYIKERQVTKAFNQRMQQKIAVAEEEVMEQVKWKGES